MKKFLPFLAILFLLLSSAVTLQGQTPEVSHKAPVHEDTNVTGFETITLNYTKEIELGDNKNLNIRKADGSLFQSINTDTDQSLITISEDKYEVHISHDAFNGSQEFYIDVDEGFVTNLNTGDASAAIDGSTEWTFTSAAGPGLAGLSPTNTPEPTVHHDAPLIIEYDEAVSMVEDKNVIIYYDDGSIFQTINTTDDAGLFSYNSTTYELTIGHNEFPESTTFDIYADEGLVTADDNDIASDVLDESSPGWSFTTASIPSITSFSPDGATDVTKDQTLELNFSENVLLGDNKNLEIYNGDDQLVQTINSTSDASLITVADNSLQITHDAFSSSTSYYILVDEGFAVSEAALVSAEGITSSTRWTFTTTTWPEVETFTPEPASTDTSILAPFEINFKDDISPGTTGTLTIRLYSDSSLIESIDYDSPQLSISNDTLTINHADLEPETQYFVTADNGLVVSSSSGVEWDGINDKSWNFTTGSAPSVTAYDPLQDEPAAPIDQPLILTFSEEIKTDSVGAIHIREEGDISFQEVSFNNGLSINGNELHIAHDNFEASTTYFILMDDELVLSAISDVAFSGINNNTEWRFTTADEPSISSLDPVNEGTLSSSTQDLAITFSENMSIGTSGTFRIYHTNADEAEFQSFTTADTEYYDVTDNVLTISPLEFLPDTGYYVTFDQGFVKSAASGIEYGGIQDSSTWSFTAPSGPVVNTLEPENNSIDIPVDSVLTLTFDEPIVRGSGNMTIHHQSDGSSYVNIDASSTTNITIDGDKLSFPGITLPYEETLYVTLDSGFVKSETSNFAFEGIAEDTTWVFTTLPSPPEFSTGYPNFDVLTPDNIDLALMTNKDAEYYLVVTSDSVTPTNNQIFNGLNADSVSAEVAANGTLTADTEFIHENIDISALTEGYYWLHTVAKIAGKEVYSEQASLKIDKVIPVTTFDPADGATNFPETGNMTISFSESVYVTGTVVDDTNVANHVSLTVTEGGASVATTVTIDTAINRITVNPDNNLTPLTNYTLTMEAVEDSIGNVQPEGTSSTFTTDQVNTWTGGGTAGDWLDEDNWTSGSFTENTSIYVPASSDPLVANSNHTVYNLNLEPGAVMEHPEGTITIDGEFRLQSSKEVNASYINSGGSLSVNADSVKIEQVITANDINYNISSPTSGATRNNMGVTNNMLTFNNSTGDYELVDNDATLTPGKGYITRSEVGKVTFPGNINTADVTAGLQRSSAGLGWNLAGNPYTASVDWTQISKTNVEDAFWLWKNDENVYGTWSTKAGTGTNLSSSNIPSNQSFWVKVLPGSSTGEITFSTSDLVANTTSYLKSAFTPEMVKIAGSNGEVKDETVVVINQNASGTLDHIDTDKRLSKSSNTLELYTAVDNKNIAINAIPEFSEDKEIPLGYYASKAGDFRIEMVNQTMTNLDSVVIIDHQEETEWLLNYDNPYHFTIDQDGSNDERFTLKMVVQKAVTNIDKDDEKQNRCEVYTQNDQIMVKTPDQDNLQYRLVDINGKTIDTGTLESMSLNEIPTPGTGIYIISVSSPADEERHKVVIH